ncbi:MAG TPA: hypothetical protein VFK16_10540 [Gemmatimonadaceae bacterium]|jgi:hypothetical protein|nr:hypothetical protein [Gemmatimonadaceae bacterium]
MPKKIARLIGLGAYAAAAGLVVLFLIVAYFSRHTALGGMDVTLQWVTWISLGGVTVLLVLLHHVLGRQILLIARDGEEVGQPLGAD